ncbi:MAG: tol-pal system protein YbgF [Nitrospirae bacterium]|nr:tol-pal system protein YbgF [Nitrospirota bacterium]
MAANEMLHRIYRTVPMLFCGASLLLASACATTADLENMRQSINTTNRLQAIEQKKDMDDMKLKVSDLSKEVAVVRDRTAGAVKESTVEALRESQANIVSRVNELSKDVQMLKGRFEESKYITDKSVKDISSERELLLSRITGLENEVKDMKTRLASNPEPSKAAEKQSEEKPAVVDPQQLYDDAQIAMEEKKYSEARKNFEIIARDFPENQLAPNAQFWTGEAFYAEKKYEEAVLAYEAFLKKYPKHDKARGAMLKQGYSFIELNDKKTAKVILERLIEKHPTSKEAKAAEKKLADMLPKKKTAAPVKKKTK